MKRFATVITAAYRPASPNELVYALNAALTLGFPTFLVRDIRGPSEPHVTSAAQQLTAAFADRSVPLQVVKCRADETALRWREGVDHVFFEYPDVDAVMVIPKDFTAPASKILLDGLQQVAALSTRSSLVWGDYDCLPGFKSRFDYDLVGMPVVEALFPEHAPLLKAQNIRRLRTEFFSLGRDVRQRAWQQGIGWTMDPTIDFELTAVRNQDLALKVVDLGRFVDGGATRNALGQLRQMVRYTGQLAVNAIAHAQAQFRDDPAAQTRACDTLRPRISAAFGACLSAIERNYPFNTNPKLTLTNTWRRFTGFTLLFDPYPCDLREFHTEASILGYVPGTNQLFDALAELCTGSWGDTLAQEYVFCRLPPSTYHLTANDGVNSDNLGQLTPEHQRTFRSFLEELPETLGPLTTLIEPLPTLLDGPIRFRFRELSVWGNAVLVAELEPVDETSAVTLREFEKRRAELNQEWGRRWGRRNGDVPFRPHISLGYFPNPTLAQRAQSQIRNWSAQFLDRLQECECSFSSVGVYSFTDMVTFLRFSAAQKPGRTVVTERASSN